MDQDKVAEYDKNYEILACYHFQGKKGDKLINELIKNCNLNYQIPSKLTFGDSDLSAYGYTALHIAQKIDDYKGFKILMENGADYTIKNGTGDTVVHFAIEQLHINPKKSIRLRKILDLVLSAHTKFENHSNPRNKNGISHFHAACIRNRIKAVKLFLNNGASINESVNVESEAFAGFTPMHFAAYFCSFHVAKLLLNRGANVNSKDAQGMTPLKLLIKRNVEIVDWINMGKRDFNDELKKEYRENEMIISIILQKIPLSVYTDDSQLSCLHIACTLTNTSKIEQLCEMKEALNQSTQSKSSFWPGYTALHVAAHFSAKTVKLLLHHGANFLAKNAVGYTPLDLCLQRYEVEDLHSFMELVPAWKNIHFFKSKASLLSSLLAMKNAKTFRNFLSNIVNINMTIPSDSPLMPGYTVLHLAVVLSEQCQDTSNIDACRLYNLNNGESDRKYLNYSRKKEKICLQRIKICLALGADVTIDDADGCTPLHLAFRLKKQSAIDLLLTSHGGIVDCVDSDRLSHLHIACAAGNKAAAERLLANNADFNRTVAVGYQYHVVRNDQRIEFNISVGSTPLHIAVCSQSTEIVKLLVNYGADICAQDANGLTPIHQVLLQGLKYNENSALTEIADVLLFSDDLKESTSSFGLSHLHVASYTNNIFAIEQLLISGANIDATICLDSCEFKEELNFLKRFNGYTPLHLALKRECKNSIIALIHSSADILRVPQKTGYDIHKQNSDFLASTVIYKLASQDRVKQSFGLTMLHAACARLDVQRVTKLLSQGADPNSQVHQTSSLWSGYTPLHFVILKRNNYPMNDIESIIDLLLNHGADVILTNANKLTPTHQAFYLNMCSKNMFQLPSRLIQAHINFNINPTDNQGLSHFHIACISNEVNLVEQFLKHGVDVNQTIDRMAHYFAGCSSLHIAALVKYSQIVDVLLKYGAEVHRRHSLYKTPIHEAAFYPRPHYTNEDTILKFSKIEKEQLHCKTLLEETPFEFFLATKRCTTNTFKMFLEDENRVNIFNPHTEMGFLAMAISHEISIENLSENTYYATLINAPEANGPDERGRTPIHNIVSIIKYSTTEEIYMTALEQLTKLGFDVDYQTKQGRTALHLAVKFQNVNGLTALLNLGADLNISDINGQTPLSYLSKWFEKENPEEAQKTILKIFLDQIEKMQNNGLYVSETNMSIKASLHKYWELCDRMRACWEAEMAKLENDKGSSTKLNLRGFLFETGTVASYPKMRPLQRQAIDQFFQKGTTQLLEEYPYFCGLIVLQYKKARARGDILKIANNSFNILTNVYVPQLCCDHILGYLSNENLKKLIEI